MKIQAAMLRFKESPMERQHDLEEVSTILIVSTYLIVFKDAMRVVEHLLDIPFPLATINAAILLILTAENCIALIRRGKIKLVPGLMALLAVIQFGIVLYHLIGDSSLGIRDLAGFAIVELAVPLAVITSAMRFDLLRFLIYSRHVKFIIILVFACAIAEAIWSHVQPLTLAGFLMGLYHNGLVAYPLQTTVGSYSIRLNGPFYSAFSMSLFLAYCIISGISYGKIGLRRVVTVLAAIILTWMTINRNGMLVLAFDLCAIVAIRVWPRINTPAYGVMFASLVGSLAIPFIGSFIGVGSYDTSSLFKLSTLASRVETWRRILSGSWMDLALGTGFVQGLGEQRDSSYMIDNLLLYSAYQAGIVVAISTIVFVAYIMYKCASMSRGVNSASGSFIILSGGVLAFGLNIVYFEPLFQLLYLAPALSMAAGVTRWRTDDGPPIEWVKSGD